jgi:hypothetical protein
MYKAQSGGYGLRHRKAKPITVMAAVMLLSIFIPGCPNDAGPGIVPAPAPDPDPVPTVTVTTVTVAGASVVTKGGSEVTETYTAEVAGDNSPPQTVTWSVDGSPAGVSISTGGVLTVEPGAGTGSITVRAASTVAGYTDKSGTKAVMINNSSDPTVTGVTVNGASSITKNTGSDVTETYTAAVAGANSPSQAVTWSVDGSPAGVSISAGGALTVQPAAGTGNITVRAASTVAGYTDKSGAMVVAINDPSSPPPPPPSETDFKVVANANLLGLYPVSDYGDGASVISAMDGRINTLFYDPTPNPNNPINGININSGNVAGGAPAMTWVINGNNLMVYGHAGNATIVFNIAVINETTGQGWITGDGNNAPYGETYLRTYSTGAEQISISDLTDGNITTAAGLTGYKVYVIVRWTDNILPADFNDETDPYNNINVIAVSP